MPGAASTLHDEGLVDLMAGWTLHPRLLQYVLAARPRVIMLCTRVMTYTDHSKEVLT